MAEPWNMIDAELADTIEARKVARGTFVCTPDESCGAAEDLSLAERFRRFYPDGIGEDPDA